MSTRKGNTRATDGDVTTTNIIEGSRRRNQGGSSTKTPKSTAKKSMKQMIAKQTKTIKDPSIERSPHGFARPTHISDELCDFMGLERNTMISRISVTNFLIDYIKKNNLQNPSNRRIILPDDKLSKIFGEESKDKVIDYFTMQKYVNHHFTPVNLSNAVLDA